jgi:hypothetical protein
MTSKNILTYNSKVSSVEQVYFSPVVVAPPFVIQNGQLMDQPLSSIYCFLSRVDPWGNDTNPDQPTQTLKYIKQVFKNMFVAKQVTSNDLSPVISRVDWTTGVTYDYFKDDVDMFALNPDGSNQYNFYVRNRYDQIFKCLWNNNSQPSTVEPYFEPGSYGTNNIKTGSDGYKWKYIYTIDSGLKQKFMNTQWIPIAIGANTPNPLISSAGAGSIDVINVTNGGSGYDPANAIITITVTGDGTGVGTTPTAVVNSGVITDILVPNTGTNYTYANVSITSLIGSGATAIAPTSPIGGHGFDPVSELGCSHVMFAVEFSGSENGYIPTNITYYQLGIVINPTSQQNNPYPATDPIYRTTTSLTVAPGFGEFINDETIYQGTDSNNPTFSGTVLSFDLASNVVYVINTVGTPTDNSSIYGKTSLTARTLLQYTPPNFTILSGYLSYIENRSGIQRSDDGIEQFKFVLGY